MKLRYSLVVLFVLVLIAGCAGSKKAARQPHPLAGDWTYQVDTPDGTYAGTISLKEAEGGTLDGVIAGEGLSGAAAMTDLMFDANKLTFKFDSGTYGVIGVDVAVAGNAFAGLINVDGVGEMPIKGARK